MTEQNTAYRTDLEPSEEEDPLAELARIVAGEPANQTVAPEPGVSFETSSQSVDEGFDIEDALLQELGEAETHQAEPFAESALDAPAVEQPKPFVSRATPVAPSQTATLEDQLMAELGASDDLAGELASELSDEAIVEETISNAVKDIEAADAEIGAAADNEALERVEAAANALRTEARPVNIEPAAEDGLEDFFSDGFEDLLAEEVATQAPDNVPPAATPQENADAELDLEDAFTAAFEQELAGEASREEAIEVASAQPEPAPALHQDELALENEFARSFADELSAAEPIVASATAREFDVHAAPRPDTHDDGAVEPAYTAQMAGDAQASGSFGGFKLAVGALGIALLLGMAVVGWGYYTAGDSGGPVVIQAESEPTKVKPEDPGGAQIANQDNEVYNRVAGTASGEPTQDELITSRDEAVVVPPKSDDRLSPDNGAIGEQASPLGISPKRVRTLTVKPDGTIVSTSASAPEAGADASQETTTLASAVSEPASPAETSAQDSTVIGIDGAQTTGQLAIPEPSPLAAVREPAPAQAPAAPVASEPAAPAQAEAPAADAPTQIASLDNQPAPAPVVTSSEWKIQVSSQRSREAAEASFSNLQRRFASILGGRSAVVERADIDGKGTFFRAKVLAESRDEATRLCSRLKSAGGSCFVTR